MSGGRRKVDALIEELWAKEQAAGGAENLGVTEHRRSQLPPIPIVPNTGDPGAPIRFANGQDPNRGGRLGEVSGGMVNAPRKVDALLEELRAKETPGPSPAPGPPHSSTPAPNMAEAGGGDKWDDILSFLGDTAAAGASAGLDGFGMPERTQEMPAGMAETTADATVAGGQSLAMNFGDEAIDMFGGDGQAVRDRVALAHDRSPVASGISSVAAAAAPMALAPASVLGRMGVAGAVGAGQAAGAEQGTPADRLAAGMKGGALSAGTAGALGGGGAALQKMANPLVNAGLAGYGAYQGYQHGGLPGAAVGLAAGPMLRRHGMLGNTADRMASGVRGLGQGMSAASQPAAAALSQIMPRQADPPNVLDFGNGVGDQARLLDEIRRRAR